MANRCLARCAAAIAPAVIALGLLGCSPHFDWREVRTEAGFSALLPGRPQVITRDVDTGTQRASMTMWSTGVGPTIFAVGTARLSPAAVADDAARAATLAFFRDALVRNIGGTDPVRPAALPSLLLTPGRNLLAADAFETVGRAGADGRKSRLAARLFIVDDRFFQVVALGADGAIPPDALDTFFSSFRLTS